MSDLIKRLSERAPNAETGDDSCLMELACEALEANAALIALLRASLRKVEDEVEGLRKDAQNWRDFAEHQTWCATCAESVDSCSEGRDLRMAALAGQKES